MIRFARSVCLRAINVPRLHVDRYGDCVLIELSWGNPWSDPVWAISFELTRTPKQRHLKVVPPVPDADGELPAPGPSIRFVDIDIAHGIPFEYMDAIPDETFAPPGDEG